jgi:hypothetical protein
MKDVMTGVNMKYFAWLLMVSTAAAVEFHGLRPTDPGGRSGLRNPERGLRTEAYIALPEGGQVFSSWEKAAHLRGRLPGGYAQQNWRLAMERFSEDGMTVGQFYIYLTDYAGRPLDDAILKRIQSEFDAMRHAGVKALLRFAYETTNSNPTNGPTLESTLKHMDQLRPLIKQNKDVLYVLQAGFVGAWGEWHSSVHIRSDEDRAAILRGLLDLAPRDRFLQVRIVPYKTRLLPLITGYPYRPMEDAFAYGELPEARIGYHNDGVLAGPSHGGSFGRGALGDPSFDLMTRESPWVPVDGELFWSDQGWNGTETKGNVLRGKDVACYLRLHHFTTFSLAHSYSEHEGNNHSIDRWRSETVTKNDLEAAKLPAADGWFEDAYGQPMSRVWYDYIRDHLGYRLEAREAKWSTQAKAGTPWSFDLTLVNRGFAAPVNPRQALLLLIPRSGPPVELPLAADPRTWQPYAPGDPEFKTLHHKISFHGKLPSLPPGDYSVALWLPDAAPSLRRDPRYAIRFANRDTTWWTDAAGRYGANILGLVSTR